MFTFNPKLIKAVKDIIRSVHGKGREENKKIEGTGFGYPKNGLLDYAIFYLDRIFVRITFTYPENCSKQRFLQTGLF